MNQKLLRYLILGSLFFIPLLGPYQGFGYEKTKVLFFISSTSLMGFVWLLTKPQLKWDLIKIASLVFILSLFVTSGLGLDFRSSFLGKDPYFQGLAVYTYLFLFSLLVSSIKIKLEHVAMVLGSSALIVSLVAIQSWITLNIFNIPVSTYAGRVVSTFGQPNFYSGFLLLALPFSYYLISQGHSLSTQGVTLNRFGLVSGLLSMIGILASYSRSAILLALLLLILGLIDQLKIKFKAGLIVLGIVIISVFLALKFSSGIVGNEISRPLLTVNPDLTKESVEKRVYIWPVARKIIIQQSIAGYGLENINKAFANYFESNKHLLFEENLNISPILISLKELNIDRSHNYILDLLLVSGIVGLLSWGVLVFLVISKIQNRVMLFGLITYLIWIQFQNQSIVHLVYFWFLVGLIDQEK